MKNKKTVLSLVLLIVAILCFSAACKRDISQKYEISFYVGTQKTASVETAGNEVITLPNAPQNEGFTFMGWYFDEGVWQNKLTENTYENQALEKNVNVYAYYLKNEDPEPEEKFTIEFKADGKTVSSITTSGNEVLTLPVAPVKENYDFVGWYFDENVWTKRLTETTYQNESLTENKTVYAHYVEKEAEKYLVTFETNGGTPVSSVTVSAIESSPETERSGFTFDGWYFDSEFQNKAEFPLSVTKEITLYAKWVQNKYLVTFETNGGTPVSSVTVSVIESSPETERSGFTFAGWYFDAEFQNKAEFPLSVTKEITLYAKWEENLPQSVEFVIDSEGEITQIKNIPENCELVIPETVDGITVKSFANYLLRYNEDIVSVTMPDTVNYLGIEMFRGCTNLKNVVFSNGLKSIAPGAFEGCTSLKEVNLPKNLVEIRSDAFAGSGIENLVLPDSVKSIWQMAFDGCANLVSINFNKVEEISKMAFRNCTSLRSVEIPDTVKALDEHNIFYGCSSLAEIKMPDKAIPVVYSIFDGTAYADKTLNPSHYENGAFYVDKYLIKMDKDFNGNSLTVRAGTLVIADSAFYVSGGGGQNGINITSVTLPDGLKRIGRSAFNGCEKLSTINIPASVESVGESAFASTALGVWNNNGFYVGNWLIQVKDISTSKFTIVDGTIGIADGGVFSSSAQTLTEIELPSSLKYIGAQAFKNTQITSVVLPVGLISIGQEAFYCCFALSQINLGDCSALRTIGEDAFTCCNFTEIRIPSSVEYIGATIFNGIQQELIVNCAVSEKPQGWSSDWAKNVAINGKKITVNWNS